MPDGQRASACMIAVEYISAQVWSSSQCTLSRWSHSTIPDMTGKAQGGHKLVAARNWCLAEEQPYTAELQPGIGGREAIWRQKTSGAILYTLRVEDPGNQTAPPKAYDTICPLYVCNPLSESPPAPHMPVWDTRDVGMQPGQECCNRATIAWA